MKLTTVFLTLMVLSAPSTFADSADHDFEFIAGGAYVNILGMEEKISSICGFPEFNNDIFNSFRRKFNKEKSQALFEKYMAGVLSEVKFSTSDASCTESARDAKHYMDLIAGLAARM